MKPRLLLLILFIVAAPITAADSVNVSGQIVFSTGNKLVSSNLSAFEKDGKYAKNITPDNSGKFILENLPYGDYEFNAFAVTLNPALVGVETKKVTIDKNTDNPLKLRFVLVGKPN